MKKIRDLFLSLMLLVALPAHAQMKATRSSALTGAKNLMLTTTSGTTYYYLVSSNDIQTLYFSSDSLRIGKDAFAKSKIKSLRFHALPRMLMDEDSTTYYRYKTLDYGLLALKRTLTIGEWNTLVLPFDLTGRQLRDAFGEDAKLATIRGIGEDDQTAIEFETISLDTDERVLRANYHYLLCPTKEPDVAEGSSLSGFGSTRVKGPLYMFPNVSLKANQSARYQTLKSADETTQVRFRGTYVLLDGSTSSNKKLAPNTYTFSEEQYNFVLHEDSVCLGAFRSWLVDISTESKPLSFYVDGVELKDGLEGIKYEGARTQDAHIYDLSGRCVTTPKRKGIYIINGKKVVMP